MLHGPYRIYTAQDNYYDYGLLRQINQRQIALGTTPIPYPPRAALEFDASNFHSYFDAARQRYPYYTPDSPQLGHGFNAPPLHAPIETRLPVQRQANSSYLGDLVPLLRSAPPRHMMGGRLRLVPRWDTATRASLFGVEEFERRAERRGIRITRPS